MLRESHLNSVFIESASELIEKFHKSKNLSDLAVGVAQEANTLIGAPVNLEIVHTAGSPDEKEKTIDMGQAEFNGFTKTDEGWQVEFILTPEGVACPCPIEPRSFKITDL